MSSSLHAQLLGTWQVIRAELGGAPMPPEAAARVEITFDAQDRYRVHFAGEVSDSGRYALLASTATAAAATASDAPQQAQHRITLYGERGTNAHRTLPGILQLRGDRLKLCLALSGDAPPRTFASRNVATGAAHYLVTYRRKTRYTEAHPSQVDT